ncbi:vgr related protein [Sphingomonas sp. AP4-R1]|uniref:vgr related protein n=1 Tax=Sphingomonas sp. AP4-R1 TaxID=2735134 RepID=UPI0020A30E47|nr:vgr related protein [Sphingomonas sp. AP4-R1]
MTEGERALAAQAFGSTLDPARARIHRARWWPFQPRNVVMAPDGDIWVPPDDALWREDYATAEWNVRALFVHELTHVWQHQSGLFLPLRRHPFCRYTYDLVPGRPLEAYGIEQQAMIVQHGWWRRAHGEELGPYRGLLPATRGGKR